ncbi:hypothetical protein [Caulobacter segnis]
MALLPEVQTCLSLIDIMEATHARFRGHAALLSLMNAWGQHGGEQSPTSFHEVLAISSAPRTMLPFIKGKGSQAIAETAVSAIEECFSSISLQSNIEDWMSLTGSHRAILRATVSIFEDIDFDPTKVAENAPEISEVLGGVKVRLIALEGLSDASRTILMCQVDLIEKSLLRFQTHGVTAFRESVFSMYGRVSVELTASKDDKVKGSLKETADDLLRVAGLIETASAVFQLVAPAALKLLAGPSS